MLKETKSIGVIFIESTYVAPEKPIEDEPEPVKAAPVTI